MVSCRVEEVDRSSDADVDSSEEDGTSDKYTLALWPADDSPTYLLLSSRQNKVMTWFDLLRCCCLGILSVREQPHYLNLFRFMFSYAISILFVCLFLVLFFRVCAFVTFFNKYCVT